MAAGKYTMDIEQGVTFAKQITVKNSDGSVRDLSGYTARMQVRLTRSTTTTLIELTTANGKIVITGPTGVIDLVLTETETKALTFDHAVYDLELVNGAEVERLLEGDIYLSKEVTR